MQGSHPAIAAPSPTAPYPPPGHQTLATAMRSLRSGRSAVKSPAPQIDHPVTRQFCSGAIDQASYKRPLLDDQGAQILCQMRDSASALCDDYIAIDD